MQSVIRLSRVSKWYGTQRALGDVSLDIPQGVVFALLGENGAGKSTAIRILLGLADADGGVAEVLGLESGKRGLDIRRSVGYVPERPTLYEWMTVSEIGWFTAGFYGGDFERRYNEHVRQFQLPPQKKIRELSKGMRAKVSLSLALAHDPKVLILDEPTSGLDTLVRREFLESMVDLAAGGKTVLLSSHQIGEVERVADYVAILSHGKLLTVARLDELKAEVREITVTLTDTATDPPRMPGEVLATRSSARQLQFVVRGAEQYELDALEHHASVDKAEVRPLGLEEIFVSYLEHAGETRQPLTKVEREDVEVFEP